jgi:Ca-activated chloride channel family protein
MGVPAEITPGLAFSVQIDVDDLAADASRVDALITIKAARAHGGGSPPRVAEVLIVDRSLSMDRLRKIDEARAAVCAAIDVIPDGAFFAIIAGNHEPELVFPHDGRLAQADARTRAEAKDRVERLRAVGGTRIGSWLRAATDLFASEPATGIVRHALLYSDGINETEGSTESERRSRLDEALAACSGQFICDVRGLGEDWDYRELQHIADALHGDAAAVLRAEDMAADIIERMRRAARLVVPRSYLRMRPDRRFRIASVAQVSPVHAELPLPQPPPADGEQSEVPLGAWEPETRLYELSLRFAPGQLPVGDEFRAAAIELLTETPGGGRARQAEEALVVQQHAVEGAHTVRSEKLTRVSGQNELRVTMRACADAWLSGERDEADTELDTAIRLARELGDVRLPFLLRVAASRPDGGYRLRRDVKRGEMQQFGLDSRTTGVRREQAELPPEDGSGPGGSTPAVASGSRVCRHCGEITEGGGFCEECGLPLDEENAG